MRGEIDGFGQRLRELRDAAGHSQAKLAELAQTHADTVVRLEHGRRLPTLELAWRLATALGVLVHELLPERWHPKIARGQRPKVGPKAEG